VFNFSLKKLQLAIAVSAIAFSVQSGNAGADTIVTQWNDAALNAIRTTHPGPPIVARALAITHTCMFDAWAAYDAKAKGTQLGRKLRRPVSEQTNDNKKKAISFAAYRCLSDLFPSEITTFDTLMGTLGYDKNDLSNDQTQPSGIGNVAAAAVIAFRHEDGSNQLGNKNGGAPYSDYTGYTPVNTPTQINDPDRWQPLQVGLNTQQFIAPHWGLVKPYAVKVKQFRKNASEPAYNATNPEKYAEQAKQVLEYSAHLTDEKKVIAEYWADGPSSELPPGHWALFAEFVSERDNHGIDDDVKMFFAMTNAVLDASIVAWDAKVYFDYVRPVTAIHFLYNNQTIESWDGSILGQNWKPYQAASVVTPPFAEYYSGHSIFSRAAAETLKLFTGSDYFGHSVTIQQGSSAVEPGTVPAQDIVLYWATFKDAADEAGISRRYGGIHFIDGDINARELGAKVAQVAWKKSQKYFKD
jgi:hypothetical protein